MPRVTPVMPPILEAKSNQVIFSDLENSLRKREGIKSFTRKITKCCGLSKKDVHHGDIPFIGIVDRILLRGLKEKSKITSEREERISLLRMIGFLYSFLVGEGSPLM